MALQAQHLADAEEHQALATEAADAGDDARERLGKAGALAEQAGRTLARDFYRAAEMLCARANAELVTPMEQPR